MGKLLIYIIILCVLFSGISCQNQSQRIRPILQKAETLIDHYPDSALALLNNIPDAKSLKKHLYYRYSLLQLQGKDKCNQDITSDTLIFDIRDFYIHNNDIEKGALSSFYCGRVLQEQGKFEKALETYLGTEKYLTPGISKNLKGLLQSSVGEIYYQQLLNDKAIIHFSQAETYFHQAKNVKNEIIACNSIGNCFLMQGKKDSTFIYYFKALALADNNKFKREQSILREGIGVAYREIKDLVHAEKFFREAWGFAVDSLEKARISYNLARVFVQNNHNDSATYYIQKSLKYLSGEKDVYLSANIYKTWSAFEEKEHDFQEALNMYKIYNKHLASILDQNKNSAVLEVQKKYNFQVIETRNKQLLIDRQRIFLFSLVLLFILIVLIFSINRRSVQNKRKLAEAEQKIYHLKELAQSFNKKENSLRNILLQHFDILKKTALLEGYLKEDDKKKGKHLIQKFNEIVYGRENLDWDLLYKTLNNINDGFFDRLRNEYPQLDESEFRICCLSYIEFSNTEIAIILNYSINTIQVKRSSIRKKLGIKAFENIHNYLHIN
jgi:DNA-binding CsgD family transcriptional regulator